MNCLLLIIVESECKKNAEIGELNMKWLLYKIRRINEVGIINCFKGIIRKGYLYYIHKKFNTPIWHINPIHFRAYAYEVIACVKNAMKEKNSGTIVELGCGVGELLSNYPNTYKKIGYDIDKSVIEAAHYLHCDLDVREGSFENIQVGNIDCMVMVNCVFGIPTEKLREYTSILIDNNNIHTFVVDTYEKNENTEYLSHNWNDIIGDKYRKTYRSRGYKASHVALQFIEVWEKKNEIERMNQ